MDAAPPRPLHAPPPSVPKRRMIAPSLPPRRALRFNNQTVRREFNKNLPATAVANAPMNNPNTKPPAQVLANLGVPPDPRVMRPDI